LIVAAQRTKIIFVVATDGNDLIFDRQRDFVHEQK